MSAVDNHKKRSRRGHLKQRHTLATKKSPMISLGTKRSKNHRRKISSLFFRRKADG